MRHLTVLLVLTLSALLVSLPSTGVAVPQPEGWGSHRDPMGFSLERPADWQVAADGQTGRINLSGPQHEQVVIWPAWAPQGLDEPTAQVVLRQFATRIGPEVEILGGWSPPQRAGENVARVVGRSGRRAAILMLCWIPTPKGAAAFFYVIAGPENAFREDQEPFSRILRSFRVTGHPSRAAKPVVAASDVTYVSWTDPREGAFSLQVPKGWSVEGGLIRRNALDPRAVLRIKSPDGAILLSGGDGEIPGFVLPNPQWSRVFPEGSWYSPGAGIQWQVRRFTPALPFGEEWLQLRLQNLCTGLEIRDRRDRSDLAEQMDREAAGFRQFGRVTNSAGDIAFTCTEGGQPRQGYLLVTTQLLQAGVLNIWYAKDLLGYLAVPSRVGQAQAILAHVASSVQVNPQWVARQQQTTMQVSQIAAQTQEHISRTIMSSYWNRANVEQELSRKWENAILGTTDVVDPVTGEQRKIYNSSDYYWINNQGRIVGTQTDSVPGLDFRRLTQLP